MKSRQLTLVACLLPLVLATPAAAGDGDEKNLDAALLAYFEVWNSGELGRLDQIVAPDFQRHGGPDETCASRRELKHLIARSRTNFKRFRLTVDDHMTEARGGAMRGSFYGVHREVDRIVEFPLMSMLRFEDGMIVEEWVLASNFLALVGLGFQLTPPGFEVILPPAPGTSEEAAPEEGSR